MNEVANGSGVEALDFLQRGVWVDLWRSYSDGVVVCRQSGPADHIERNGLEYIVFRWTVFFNLHLNI